MGRLKGRAEKACQAVQGALAKAKPAQTAVLEAGLEKAFEAVEHVEQAQQDYHDHLVGISEAVHPFALTDNARQTSERVVSQLEQRVEALETLAHQQGIQDKDGAVQTFRNQIQALASHVRVWWEWVEDILRAFALDEATREWLTDRVLPVMYWHYQQEKTQNPAHRLRYRQAWQQAVETWEADPFGSELSESEQERWLA